MNTERYMEPWEFKLGTIFWTVDGAYSPRDSFKVIAIADKTMVKVVNAEKPFESGWFYWDTTCYDSVKISDAVPDGCLP